jgi:hypothetical protein
VTRFPHLTRVAFLWLIVLCLAACQPAATADEGSPSAWQVSVSNFEVHESFRTVETVTQYDGSTLEVEHVQSPPSGTVYAILQVSVRKVDNQSTAPFVWTDLVIEDSSGGAFPRIENDTFLSQYQYSPRLTGLELRFGENTGWICFQVPAGSVGGPLTLVYTAEGIRQEIPLDE